MIYFNNYSMNQGKEVEHHNIASIIYIYIYYYDSVQNKPIFFRVFSLHFTAIWPVTLMFAAFWLASIKFYVAGIFTNRSDKNKMRLHQTWRVENWTLERELMIRVHIFVNDFNKHSILHVPMLILFREMWAGLQGK